MFSAETSGFEEALARLNRFGNLDNRGLMNEVGAVVTRQTKTRITSEKTAPSGKPWAPLKPSTIARKGNSNILIHHGRLVGSVAFSADSAVVVVGTTPFYGGFHQSGTRKMPAREFVGLSSQNASEVENVVAAFVARQLAA